jgi:hypothetical protein
MFGKTFEFRGKMTYGSFKTENLKINYFYSLILLGDKPQVWEIDV